ncbi:hemolysin family protein [Huintestinicola sp.]|uniref:hemolysin family protein n=1 Tax=Huintestinicola sp. TaxID=2981661 RepID=UPI00307BC8AF
MEYAAIILLIIMSAFFSATETAFSSVNKIRLKHEASNGNKKAARALKIAENFDKTLTTILVGNNIVNILSTSLGTVICTELFGAKGVGIATAAMTVLILIFGEIMPKSLAKENAEKFALSFGGLLNVFIVVLTPVTFIFRGLKNLVSKLFKSGSDAPSVTEDELKYIIDEIEEEGVLEEQESDLVRSALEFDDKNVSEVLIPRVRITAVEKNDSLEHIRELFFTEQYSRMPVYEKNIDNIIGFIHERDFFKLTVSDEHADGIESIIHEVIYITEFQTVSEVLARMQKEKIHMAIIKDQYGGTYGMVTMEDLIEELLGEIYDETDEEDHSFIKISDNEYDAAADFNLREFEEKLGLPEDTIKSESYTLGGWALELFGRIPQAGDEVKDGVFTLKVLEAEENRIIRLKITVDKPDESENKDSE